MTDPWSGARKIARAHELFLHHGREPTDEEVREAILASWRRSRTLGVSQQELFIPLEQDMDPDTRLLRACTPALDQLNDRLAGVPVAILVTDAQGRIVARRGDTTQLSLMDDASLVLGASCAERHIGTNSISMALSTRAPFVVVGQEHFFHSFQVLVCMAAPVRDPMSGGVEAVLNLSIPREAAHPRMAVVLEDAVNQVEHRLLELSTARERALASEFLAAREPDRPAGTLLHMRSGALTTTEEPLRTLKPDDRATLLHKATEMISSEGATLVEVPLHGGGSALLRRRTVHHGEAYGVAIEVSLSAGARHHPVTDRDALPLTATPPNRPAPPPATPREPVSQADRWLLLVGEPGVGKLAVAARQRLSLLNETGARLVETLDVRRITEVFASTLAPQLADLVTVDLIDGVVRGTEPQAGPPPPRTLLLRTAAHGALPAAPGPADGRFGTGQTFTFPPQTPQARCLAHGRTVLEPVLGEPSDTAPDDAPTAAARHLGPGEHWLLAVPLRYGDRVLGLATFYRAAHDHPFEEDDIALAEELTTRAATCVDNGCRYTRERVASLTLQRSLLPGDLTPSLAVEVASRYLPADDRTGVGGDWYDVIPLSSARVALVVGDVVGHGLHAAATMGRLRTAVRTLADLDLPPEEVLARLDDLVSRFSPDGDAEDSASGATCLYAVYDPVSRQCTAARAGHPPPALTTPDGTTRLLDLPAGPPLGLGRFVPHASADVDIPPGSVLALYTDGLVTSRGRQSTPGDRLNTLLTTLGRREPSLERACDDITAALAPDGPHDDIALLLARTHELAGDRVAQWELPPEPSAVREARALVDRQLTRWGLAHLTHGTALIVSELVTNAVRYGGKGPVQVRLLRGESLVCEVTDHSNSSPRIRRAGTSEEGGRGLFLVARFSHAWGARYRTQGKTVWAEQPVRQALSLTLDPDNEEDLLLSLYDDPYDP
ncbi:SpoIIE family protein phosphatase [Streptomyces sp. NPDC051207]|uniref:SpoIIE family protein phosphatase n=1 Tax=Streptomyces sp. NPDC051207 TaxID=3154641 RepID=UPI00342C0FBC